MTTWIKLHDNFWENPKVLAAGEDAALLYIQGLSYCSRNLTDGAIPTPALRNLTAKKEARTLARVLVREGLWRETGTGWMVHDYLEVQRSREQVEAEREKARERQRKARVTASSRRESQRTSGEVTADVTGTVRVPDAETEPETETPPSPPDRIDQIVDAVFVKVLTAKQKAGEIRSVDGFRTWWDENDGQGARKRATWFLEHFEMPSIGHYADATYSPVTPQWALSMRREVTA